MKLRSKTCFASSQELELVRKEFFCISGQIRSMFSLGDEIDEKEQSVIRRIVPSLVLYLGHGMLAGF